MGVRGRRPVERLAGIVGFSHAESFVDMEVDGHPRIIGRLVAWKLPDGVLTNLFTSQDQWSLLPLGFVELSESSSAPIRPPVRLEVWRRAPAGLLLMPCSRERLS
jgi:hypothetical protein